MALTLQAGGISPQSSETLLASTSFFCSLCSFYFNVQNGCSDLCPYYICVSAERKDKGTMKALATSLLLPITLAQIYTSPHVAAREAGSVF